MFTASKIMQKLNDDTVITTKEASRILGLAPHTLENLRCRGSGPPFLKYGSRRGRVFYRASDVFQWRDSHLHGSTSSVRGGL